MSDFDPATFMSMTITEANSTESVPVPEGEYPALADKVDVKTWSSKDGSSSGLKLEIVWDIQDEAVKELMNRTKVTSRQQIMMDLTDTGQLDTGKGKNVGLGRLRTAVGLNEPGKPFAFEMIQGQMAKVIVKPRIDKNDPTKIYDEVVGVVKYA